MSKINPDHNDANKLALKYALVFTDLYCYEGLLQLDRIFTDSLASADASLCQRLIAARANPAALDKNRESELLIELAPHVETFIGELFGIDEHLYALSARAAALNPLYSCKKKFVQRVAKKVGVQTISDEAAQSVVDRLTTMFGEPFSEMAFARHVMDWLADSQVHAEMLALAADFAEWAVHSQSGRQQYAGGVLFHLPVPVDPMQLVPLERVQVSGAEALQGPRASLRHREGFKLTDGGCDLSGALEQAHYCVWCHHQGRDSCSIGLKDKEQAQFKQTGFGVQQAGCPLEEKISELNLLAADGHLLGALAVACVNNPLLAATGHRICNDCMKACIYQKQQAVNIPEVESRILKEVLHLPWGFEVYSLLTRWNPLNLVRPLPQQPSGYKVLIAGLGPAGFTLAHQLMQGGHSIIAVDGLKIEPLAPEISGVMAKGQRVQFRPIRDINVLYESLDEPAIAEKKNSRTQIPSLSPNHLKCKLISLI
ncbi:MAG: pyridine nucleotide-disulfide oxidoreductase, partial [Zetaproteobacteria bacterium CG_4_9_14_3_um_filter_49_83]